MTMNRHVLMDSLPVKLASRLFWKTKLFRHSLDSMPYDKLLKSIEIKWPMITGTGVYEVPAQTPRGIFDPAFRITCWRGNSYPTVIYHHGNNERPFNRWPLVRNTFHDIFLGDKRPFPANLIVVRAPFHRSFWQYLKYMGQLSTFSTLMAVSVLVIENLRNYAASKSCGVVVSGISLGGWVTNLHRAYFNSADLYLPLLAGTTPADVFTHSVYRKLTDQKARKNPRALENALDFKDAFAARQTNNVFPLLARFDQLIRYEKQKASYGNIPVAVIERGHVTGSMAASELRRHIQDHIALIPAKNVNK